MVWPLPPIRTAGDSTVEADWLILDVAVAITGVALHRVARSIVIHDDAAAFTHWADSTRHHDDSPQHRHSYHLLSLRGGEFGQANYSTSSLEVNNFWPVSI
jgi:hypothetical protein